MAGAQGDNGDAVTVTFTFDDEADVAVEALTANYRVSAAEVSALGLLTTKNKGDICLALVDYQTLKKLSVSAAPN